MSIGHFIWRATFATDPMRPIDGDKHKVIVEKIVEQLEEMGVPTPKWRCRLPLCDGRRRELHIINSRSISCDSDTAPV